MQYEPVDEVEGPDSNFDGGNQDGGPHDPDHCASSEAVDAAEDNNVDIADECHKEIANTMWQDYLVLQMVMAIPVAGNLNPCWRRRTGGLSSLGQRNQMDQLK
ncbi:hypothetical protein FIBSPDRAFT_968199 [Athelia psychrophila]|uniref:Uncharacterized protein n=1 Tax=Athelia psychrophila TaxID=1759441 RepID=A0A167UW75_9AGAM|nr:hypothetical protein FIBSPDRAFT_968199 [Fibularhizoctonia sp. CBS 109695]